MSALCLSAASASRWSARTGPHPASARRWLMSTTIRSSGDSSTGAVLVDEGRGEDDGALDGVTDGVIDEVIDGVSDVKAGADMLTTGRCGLRIVHGECVGARDHARHERDCSNDLQKNPTTVDSHGSSVQLRGEERQRRGSGDPGPELLTKRHKSAR